MKTEERRHLTILFADLSGFTALSAEIDPEEVREVASTCFEHLNRPIVKHGGTVHKYEGDLVIALFGYPAAHEDDPERTVQAALEMMQAIPDVNRVLASKLARAVDLGLHVGINMGTVVAGEIGTKEKAEYTVMGDVVNMTARLKDIAQRGEVIVSESVFRVSRYRFDYEARPAVAVKGVKEPVKVYRPLKFKEHPDPKRGIKGLNSPMVGRAEELAQLKQAVTRLAGGQGGVVFVLGGAGLGKSRLIDELRSDLAGQRLPILQLLGRCLSYGDAVPYWPFLQILEKLFDISEEDSRKAFQEKLLRKAREIFPDDWAEIVPYLGYLFSLRFAEDLDDKVRFLDAQGLKVQIMATVKRLLVTLARGRPILLVIDDYHWIDPASLELLEFIFAPVAGAPAEPTRILLVAVSRIEKDVPHFRTKERLKRALGKDSFEIILKPLEDEDSTKLVYNLLNVPGITAAFKDKILARAEGNPFYVEEIIRSLIDTGVLVYRDGVWSLSRGPQELKDIRIPDSVQAVIASRLDKLAQDVRDVLQMAAVVGRNFRAPILEQLSALDGLMLSLYLATLEEYEYILSRKEESDDEYSFRHPLLQEVAYSGLLLKRRRELHRRTGELIERMYADRLDEFTDLLAYQYANSDRMEKAQEWLMKAGAKAQQRYANDEAIGYFTKLVDLARGDDGQPEVLAAASEALGDVYSLKAEYEAALACYEATSKAAIEPIARSRAQRKMAERYYDQDRYSESLKMVDDVMATLADTSEVELAEKIELHMIKTGLLRTNGEPMKAMEQARVAVDIVDGLLRRAGTGQGAGGLDRGRLDELKIAGFNGMAGAAYDSGDYDRARELYIESLKIAERSGNKRTMMRGLANMGSILSSRGDVERSIDYYKKAQAMAKEIGDKRAIGGIYSDLAGIAKDKGDFREALELYEQARRICREMGVSFGVAAASANMGMVYQMLGELDRAMEAYTQNVEIFRALGVKRPIAVSLSLLGDVVKEKGDYDKAVEYLLEALKVHEEAGDRRGVAATLIGLGSAYLDKRDAAQSGCYLEKAEEALKDLRDPYEFLRLYAYRAELGIFEMRQSEASKPRSEILEYLEKGLKSAQEVQTKYGEAVFYMIRGEYFGLIDDFSQAEKDFEQAIELFARIDFKKMLAETHLEYGRMLRRAAKRQSYPADAADVQFDRAVALFKEMKLGHRIKAVEAYRKD